TALKEYECERERNPAVSELSDCRPAGGGGVLRLARERRGRADRTARARQRAPGTRVARGADPGAPGSGGSRTRTTRGTGGCVCSDRSDHGRAVVERLRLAEQASGRLRAAAHAADADQ